MRKELCKFSENVFHVLRKEKFRWLAWIWSFNWFMENN